jgi:hypothetical protein
MLKIRRINVEKKGGKSMGMDKNIMVIEKEGK